MLTEQDINTVLLSSFADESTAEQKRILKNTLEFDAWLEAQGRTWPDSETDYEGYRLELKRRVGKNPTQAYKAADKAVMRVKAVYKAIAKQKGDLQVSEVIDVEAAASEAEQVHDSIQPKPKRGGRKVLDPNGEKRSEKVMLYLTPTLMSDVKDLASLYGKSLTDYIISVIEGYIVSEKVQDKLALFRELRDNE